MYTETQHVEIGYCLNDSAGGFAFAPPRSVFSTRSRPLGARAIQNCPAVNAIERQLVEIPSPMAIGLALDFEDGEPELTVLDQGTFIMPENIGNFVSIDPAERWRHPKKPVIRIRLPFFFVTDEPCFISLIPPFLGPAMRRWPGLMVAGRFPLTVWPQDLDWCFEWDRPDRELQLKQGEPIAYAMFEFDNPNKRPKLVEAALTQELAEYRAGMEGIHHLTPNVEEIWAGAHARRPARLMVPLDEAENA